MSRSRVTSACDSPIVQSTSWWVSALLSIRSDGSSAPEPGQRLRELVLVGLAVRDDRDRQQRLRHRPRPQHPLLLHRRERVAGLGPGQSADRAQVAGDDLVRRALGPAERVGERADPLVLVVVGMARGLAEERGEVPGDVHGLVGHQRSGEDPDQAEPADVRVAGGLHDLGDQRSVGVAGDRVGGRCPTAGTRRGRGARRATGSRARRARRARCTRRRSPSRRVRRGRTSPARPPARGRRRAPSRRSPRRRRSGPSGSRPRTPRSPPRSARRASRSPRPRGSGRAGRSAR